MQLQTATTKSKKENKNNVDLKLRSSGLKSIVKESSIYTDTYHDQAGITQDITQSYAADVTYVNTAVDTYIQAGWHETS